MMTTGERRPTIGLLCGSLQNEYDVNLWLGVRQAARRRGCNALCFPGGPLEDSASVNVLCDMVGEAAPPRLDGWIVWSHRLAGPAGAGAVRAFLDRLAPLPIVNVGRPLPGVPSLMYDNRQGMRDIVTHLIEVHHCRRIAYLNWQDERYESQERYRGYVEALAAHDIPLDPALVIKGQAMTGRDSARRQYGGIYVLLDGRGARPQVDFDAVVGCNDRLALAAAETLLERGFQIPQDVAVAGFDDLAETRVFTPPLATVRHSFVELGAQAVEVLWALLEGQTVAEQTMWPMPVIPRPSCGCLSAIVARAAAAPETRRVGVLEVALAAQREEVIAEMSRQVESGEVVRTTIARIFDAFLAELCSHSAGAFLLALDEALTLAATDVYGGGGANGRHPLTTWHNLLSVLRYRVLACIDDESRLRAEALWQQARVMIDEAAYQAQARREFQNVEQAMILHDIGRTLGRTTDVPGFVEAVAQSLRRVDWPTFYLALYEGRERPVEWARLMLGYLRGERVSLETGGRRFPALQLLPDGVWPGDTADVPPEGFSLVVAPLYMGTERLGVVLFDLDRQEGATYEVIRHELSSALYSAALFEERARAEAALELAYAEIEQQVAERAAALEREVLERERVQAETARLQQELIATQQRIIQELSTPVIPLLDLPQGGSVIVVPVVGNVDSLRAREITRRLLQSIREYRAKVVILDITGVPLVDSGVAAHLNKTIHAARLKGARTIITGVSDAVAETIVDLGIDWSDVETRRDLQSGLRSVLGSIRE